MSETPSFRAQVCTCAGTLEEKRRPPDEHWDGDDLSDPCPVYELRLRDRPGPDGQHRWRWNGAEWCIGSCSARVDVVLRYLREDPDSWEEWVEPDNTHVTPEGEAACDDSSSPNEQCSVAVGSAAGGLVGYCGTHGMSCDHLPNSAVYGNAGAAARDREAYLSRAQRSAKAPSGPLESPPYPPQCTCNAKHLPPARHYAGWPGGATAPCPVYPGTAQSAARQYHKGWEAARREYTKYTTLLDFEAWAADMRRSSPWDPGYIAGAREVFETAGRLSCTEPEPSQPPQSESLLPASLRYHLCTCETDPGRKLFAHHRHGTECPVRVHRVRKHPHSLLGNEPTLIKWCEGRSGFPGFLQVEWGPEYGALWHANNVITAMHTVVRDSGVRETRCVSALKDAMQMALCAPPDAEPEQPLQVWAPYAGYEDLA